MLFCIDISGSMKGRRIENAANNAVRVYDQYTTRDDHVGLVWFDSKVEHKTGGLKGRNERGLRALIDSTRGAIRGATAFYDAIIQAVQTPPARCSAMRPLTPDVKSSEPPPSASISSSPDEAMYAPVTTQTAVKPRRSRLATTGGTPS